MDKSIVITIIICLVIFVPAGYIDIRNAQKKRRETYERNRAIIENKSMALQILNNCIRNFNVQTFLQDRFNDFVAVQIAWMEFDYDKLKELLTDELYNQYVMQLETLKNDCSKNIMYDFKYDSSVITEAHLENQILTVKIELSCSFRDFIEKLGYVSRGDTRITISHTYELTYVCNLSDKGDFCPNCGSKIDKRRNVCSYCGSIFANIPSKWVMSNKMSKYQINTYE